MKNPFDPNVVGLVPAIIGIAFYILSVRLLSHYFPWFTRKALWVDVIALGSLIMINAGFRCFGGAS